MNETAADILSYIPQRPPFVMVDRVMASDESSTKSSFRIRENNIFVEGGKLKEPGLVENIAQTAAARAGFKALSEDQPVKVGFIGAIRNLQVLGFPDVGSDIETEITVVNQVFDVSVISGKVTCKGLLLAACEMKIFIINQ